MDIVKINRQLSIRLQGRKFRCSNSQR